MIFRSLMLATAMLCSAAAAGERDSGSPQSNSHQDILYLSGECPVILRIRIQIEGEDYEMVWSKYVESYYDGLDTDDDGVLSAREARGLPTPDNRSETNAPKVDESTAIIKTSPSVAGPDRVQPMTKADLKARLEKAGQRAFSVASVHRTSTVSALGMFASGPGSMDLFSLLDTDRDGTLSLDELGQSTKTLHKWDLDDDEMISVQELQRNQYRSLAPTQTTRRANSEIPFVQLKSLTRGHEKTKQIAQDLLKKYDLPGANSRSGDGRLSPSEVKLGRAVFSRADVDADEYLSETEISQFLLNPAATLEVLVRLGDLTGAHSRFEVLGNPESDAVLLERASDGSPTIRLKHEQIDFTVQEPHRGGSESVKRIVRQQFAIADTDTNNYVDQDEVERSPALKAVFDQVDADLDRKIFAAEVLAYLDQRFVASDSSVRLSVFGPHRSLFEILDSNSDGRLSKHELSAATQRFEAWDQDKDDELSKAELPKHFRLSLGRATPELGLLGVASAAMDIYLAAAQIEHATSGPNWFRTMDRNRDGDLSKREFLFDADLFHQLDADNNGSIDAGEARQTSAVREKRP